MDEATSQLDAVNELALLDLITDIARHTTVLIVAHRLSTVTNADQIIVMDGGRIRAKAPTPSWSPTTSCTRN
jgi:ABC-type multidrug transport system fused ATPase/permease subunit